MPQMLSSLARQKDRYDEAALRLQEAGAKTENGDVAYLYSRAWAQAFTASRHIMLADRNANAADASRTSANLAAAKRRDPAPQQSLEVRSKELDLIAQRHRAAAQAAAQKAAELEFEASRADEEARQAKGGQQAQQRPGQPQQRPPAQPQRGGQPMQRPTQPQQPPQRSTAPVQAPQRQAERPQPVPAQPAAPPQPPPAAAPAQPAPPPAAAQPAPPPVARPRAGGDGDGDDGDC